MGIGSLKKPANTAATTPAADDFINGARVDGKNAKPTAAKEKVYKRITFSLSEEIDKEVDRLSLVPRDFRASRSDVIRAAVALLGSLPEAEIARLIKEASAK